MAVEDNIPEGWVKSSIGELTYFVGEKISPTELTVYNYISTENLLSDKKGVVVSSNLPNVSKVNEFRIGDTLFSNIRTYFKKVWQANINGGSSNDVLIFRPLDESQLNKSYLYRIISSDLFIDFTVKTAKGTKMPRGDKNAIRLFQVNLPPLPEQKAIAKVLTAFDDKIELLQAQNKTLEIIAQTIFKEWFGKYQIGDELPEDWRFGVLGEIVTPLKGKNLTKKQVVPGAYPVIAGGLKPSVFHNICNTKAPVLTVSASGANAGYVALHHTPVWSSDSTFIDKSFTDSFYFIYVFLKNNQSLIYDKQEGSAIPHVYPRHLENLEMVIPKKIELEKYEKVAENLFNKISNNKSQIQSLTKTRDTLLPKLMSGQVRVKNLNQTADA